MMLAELYGKAASKLVRSEDVLTSHAFGVLEVLKPSDVLLPWLATARRTDGAVLSLPEDVRAVHFAYWPAFTHVAGKRNQEVQPDVLVTVDTASGAVLLLIEAKYHSGPSGYPTGPEDKDLKGQLSLQWSVLQAIPPSEAPGQPARIAARRLVYLTADLSLPERILGDMGAELAKVKLDPAVFASGTYWLDWRRLGTALEQATNAGLLGQRLLQVLDKRNLLAFAGCRSPKAPRVQWGYQAQATPFALTPPNVARVPWAYEESMR